MMLTINIGYQPGERCQRAISEIVGRVRSRRLKLQFFPITYESIAKPTTAFHLLLLDGSRESWEWYDIVASMRRKEMRMPIILILASGVLKEKVVRVKEDKGLLIIDDTTLMEGLFRKIFVVPEDDRKIVLFVDDDPNVLSGYRRAFYKAPYEVLTAESAQEALEMLKMEQVDLMVTDIKMPGMHGFQLIEEVRKVNDRLPIIVCSGYHKMKEDSDLFFLNVAAFVSKPVDMSILSETIRRVLASQ
jgi:CheY-like chemotaxis protein